MLKNDKQDQEIKVEVIRDSVSQSGARITSLELTYPSFVHSNILRFRNFSRTSTVGARPGTVKTLVTATNFSDFDMGDKTDDIVYRLACTVHEAIDKSEARSTPDSGIHVPYVFSEDIDEGMKYTLDDMARDDRLLYSIDLEKHIEVSTINIMKKVSAARCYKLRAIDVKTNKPTSIGTELSLFDQIIRKGTRTDLTALEHIGTPDTRLSIGAGTRWHKPFLHSNFTGWCQYSQEWVGVDPSAPTTIHDVFEALQANENEVERLRALLADNNPTTPGA